MNVVDEYLVTNPSRPIYTEDLCKVLRLPGSAGRCVPRELRHCEGPLPLVRSVANAHGFWHPRQFACDYRAMCGETPSETLARTRGLALHDAQDPGLDDQESVGGTWLRHA